VKQLGEGKEEDEGKYVVEEQHGAIAQRQLQIAPE
jgi:hypothetical protein